MARTKNTTAENQFKFLTPKREAHLRKLANELSEAVDELRDQSEILEHEVQDREAELDSIEMLIDHLTSIGT